MHQLAHTFTNFIPSKYSYLTGIPLRSFSSNDGKFLALNFENFSSSSINNTLAKNVKIIIGTRTIKNLRDLLM